MFDIWQKGKQELHNQTQDQKQKRTVVMIGDHNSGKRTIVNLFKRQTDIHNSKYRQFYTFYQRNEMDIEFYFINGVDQLRHLDTIINSDNYVNLILIYVVDLTQTDSMVDNIHALIQQIRLKLNLKVRDILRHDETKLQQIRDNIHEKFKDNPDKLDLDILCPNLVMIATKYDVFESLEMQSRKIMATILRSIAHNNGFSLFYNSCQGQRYQNMSQSVFESIIMKNETLNFYQKDYTKQIYISSGQDSNVIIQMPSDNNVFQYKKYLNIYFQTNQQSKPIQNKKSKPNEPKIDVAVNQYQYSNLFIIGNHYKPTKNRSNKNYVNDIGLNQYHYIHYMESYIHTFIYYSQYINQQKSSRMNQQYQMTNMNQQQQSIKHNYYESNQNMGQNHNQTKNPKQNQYDPNYGEQYDQYIDNPINIIQEPNGICRSIMLLCPILLAITVLVLFSIIIGYQNSWDHTKKRDTIESMYNLDRLMNAPLFKDFKPIDNKKPCPTGYDQQSIGTFEGVHSECVCKDGSIHNYAHCAFSSSCQYQSSIKPIIYKIWNGNKICAMKSDMTKTKYLSVGKSCESGYKKCAYNICSKDDKCPMSRIQYGQDVKTKKQTLTIDNQSEPKGKEYGPIIGFTSVESKTQKPCLLYQYYKPVTESLKNYPGFIAQLTGCGLYGHNIGLVKIETIPSATFESDNKLTDIYKNLQYYNELMNSKTKNIYSLLSVSRPQFKRDKKCEMGSYKDGLEVAKHTHDYININIGFGIAVLVLCSLTIIIGIILITKITKTISMMFTYQLLGFMIALLVIIYITTIWIYLLQSNINDHHTKFTILVNNSCFPQSYINPAKQLANLINMFWDIIYWLGISAFIVSCSFIVIELIAITLREPEWRCSPVGVIEDQLIEY